MPLAGRRAVDRSSIKGLAFSIVPGNTASTECFQPLGFKVEAQRDCTGQAASTHRAFTLSNKLSSVSSSAYGAFSLV
jgi:hypothetical protein